MSDKMEHYIAPGSIRAAAASALKKLQRPTVDGVCISGYDNDYIDIISEEYEYFVVPDSQSVPQKELERNLDKVINACERLSQTLEQSRLGDLTSRYYKQPVDDGLYGGLTMRRYQNETKRLMQAAKELRSERVEIGRKPRERPLLVSIKLSQHFHMLTREAPTLAKRRGYDFVSCVERLFVALSMNEDAKHYAGKAIDLRSWETRQFIA